MSGVGAVVPADLSSRGLFASRAKIWVGCLARFKDLWDPSYVCSCIFSILDLLAVAPLLQYLLYCK